MTSRAAKSYRQKEVKFDQVDNTLQERRKEFIELSEWYLANRGDRIDGRLISSLRNRHADRDLLRRARDLDESVDPRRHVPMPSALPPLDEVSELDWHDAAIRYRRLTGIQPSPRLTLPALHRKLRLALHDARNRQPARKRVSV